MELAARDDNCGSTNLDSLDFRGHIRPAFGVVASWSHDPLVAYHQNGFELDPLINDLVVLHVQRQLEVVAPVAAVHAVVGQDGIVTLRRIKKEFAGVRVIAVSGGDATGRIDLRKDAELLGAARTLRKPFSPAELRGVVEETLALDSKTP